MTAKSTLSPFARWTLVPGATLALLMSTVSVSAPSQAQIVRPDFFGMHDHHIVSGSVPGVRTGAARLWDTGTTWRAMTDTLGQLNLDPARRAVATAEAAGLRPMLVLGQTPQIYAEDPTAPGHHGPGSTSMPLLPAWQAYVEAVAHEFGNRVDYQIWNEPNVTGFWSGSVDQMATLTATASKAIRGIVGKRATVVAPSFPLRLKGQRTWYREYWSQKVDDQGMASYVNTVSVNLYPLEKKGPEAQLPLLRYARSALPKAARKKPMWNTEINYGLVSGEQGTAKEISEAKQAAYVSRTLLLNAGSPIRRVYWYSWTVGPIANTHLVESDRTTLTRAGRAWDVTRRWTVGTNFKNCKRAAKGRTKGLYTCTARKSRREVRRFYWKPTGRAVRIRTHRTTKKVVKLSGATSRPNRSVRLKVGKSPVMVTSRR